MDILFTPIPTEFRQAKHSSTQREAGRIEKQPSSAQTRRCAHRFNYANSQGFFLCGLGHFFTNNNNLPVLYSLDNVGGAVFIGKDNNILLPGGVI
jgi:hypothetical protein